MEYIYKLKDMLCKELESLAKKEKLAGMEVESVWKLSDTIKNLEKILILSDEGNSESRHSYTSYDDEMSYRRGRGKYAKRDSMGRYSRDDGYSERDDSYDSVGNSMRRDGYSRDEGKDRMMSHIGSLMERANHEEREVLKKCMRDLEEIE